MSKFILHIPHSSRAIPADLRESILLTDEELEAELDAVTAHATEKLFDMPGARRVVFPVSRLVVDPAPRVIGEGAPVQELPAPEVPEQTLGGRSLRRTVSEEERAELLRRFIEPHHQALEDAIAAALEEHNQCFVIDCQSYTSYPEAPLPGEDGWSGVCIGTDRFHTPERLVERMDGAWPRDCEHAWRINEPFTGIMVPPTRFREDARVMCLRVMIREDLYWNRRRRVLWQKGEGIPGMIARGLAALGEFEFWDTSRLQPGDCFCPFCGQTCGPDGTCTHVVGGGSESGFGSLLGWEYGPDVGFVWERLQKLYNEHEGALLRALSGDFAETELDHEIIQEIRFMDRDFPSAGMTSLRASGAEDTGGFPSDATFFWFTDDVEPIVRTIERVEDMANMAEKRISG